ncbi:MAG: ABC transporter permease [Clostridia bacterium]|nr:ABC transporter permease [Clostridia bacterium]
MLWECVTMSLDNIRSNKVRSFLTLLGIMIGVTAVIALITTVSGVTGSISNSFTELGVGTITVSVTGTDLKTGVNAEDLARLSALETVDGVVPSVNLSGRVAYGKKVESNVTVAGKNAYYFNINPDLIVDGRALNFVDDDNASYVCVISQSMVDTFFFGVNPVGETLYLSGLPFTVVGRYDTDSGGGIAAIFTGRPDVIIPYTTGLRVLNTAVVNSFTVYLAEGATSKAASEEMEALLDSLFDFEEDTFTITTMDTIEDTMQTMMGMMSSLLAGIASIALVVGGIGIMNMMLTTVTERTMEIGLKKALGAIPWQIQVQFLIESFLLSLIGGFLGILLGLALSWGLSRVLDTVFVLNWGAVALGVGFSAAVGIIFGWAPARKASRLNPIDALRAV